MVQSGPSMRFYGWQMNLLIPGRMIFLRTSLLVDTVFSIKKVTLNIGRVEMINAIVDATTNRQDVIATS